MGRWSTLHASAEFLRLPDSAEFDKKTPGPIRGRRLRYFSHPGCRNRLAESLDDGGVGHPAALAHRLQAVPAAALLESIHKCGHDAGTTRARWMSDRDRPAVDVGLGQIRSGVMGPGQCQVVRDPAIGGSLSA